MQYRIEFLRPSDKYFPGDKAAFPLGVARRFVDAGKARWLDSPPNGDGDRPSTHGHSAAGVRVLASATEDLDELRELWDSEHAYPGSEGRGRRSVVTAIERRFAQLGGDVASLKTVQEPEADTEPEETAHVFTRGAANVLASEGIDQADYDGDATGNDGKVSKADVDAWLEER